MAFSVKFNTGGGIDDPKSLGLDLKQKFLNTYIVPLNGKPPTLKENEVNDKFNELMSSVGKVIQNNITGHYAGSTVTLNSNKSMTVNFTQEISLANEQYNNVKSVTIKGVNPFNHLSSFNDPLSSTVKDTKDNYIEESIFFAKVVLDKDTFDSFVKKDTINTTNLIIDYSKISKENTGAMAYLNSATEGFNTEELEAFKTIFTTESELSAEQKKVLDQSPLLLAVYNLKKNNNTLTVTQATNQIYKKIKTTMEGFSAKGIDLGEVFKDCGDFSECMETTGGKEFKKAIGDVLGIKAEDLTDDQIKKTMPFFAASACRNNIESTSCQGLTALNTKLLKDKNIDWSKVGAYTKKVIDTSVEIIDAFVQLRQLHLQNEQIKAYNKRSDDMKEEMDKNRKIAVANAMKRRKALNL